MPPRYRWVLSFGPQVMVNDEDGVVNDEDGKLYQVWVFKKRHADATMVN